MTLKNQRGGFRALLKTQANDLRSHIEGKRAVEVTVTLSSVKDTLSKIKDLDSQIFSALVEEKEITKELLEQNAYHNPYLVLVQVAENFLSSLKPDEPGQPASPMPGAPNYKLRTLSLPKFAGNVLEYQSWYDQFAVAVEDNQSLSRIEKFLHLKSLLEGEAAKAIEGYSLTDANYASALQTIKDRYGKKSKQISAHVSELLNLSELTNMNPKGLRDHYYAIEAHIRSLEALKVTTEMYGCILMPILLSKVPQPVRLSWARTEDSEAEIPDVSKFLLFFKREVEAREEAGHSMVSKKSDTGLPSKKNQFSGKSSSALHTSAGNYKNVCVFCKGNHRTFTCKLALNKAERWRRIIDSKACFLCLNGGHLSSECTIKDKVKCCKTCNGKSKHNELLCVEGDPTTAVTHVSANTPVMTSSANCIQAVYKTLAVVAQGQRHMAKVRVLIDDGAGRSFITTKLSRRLGCREVDKEDISLDVFGGESVGMGRMKLVELKLLPVFGDEEFVVRLLEVPKLCGPIPFPPIELCRSELDRMNVLISDVSASDMWSNDIQIIIGLDLLPMFFLPVSRRISKGIFAQKTRLGWSLWGNAVGSGRISRSSVNFVSMSQSPVWDVDNASLDRMWSLEGVGISPEETSSCESPVYSRFKETLGFDGERYVVSLPWKSSVELDNNNFGSAVKRYQGLTRKLQGSSSLLKDYRAVFSDYENAGIIEKVLGRSDGPREFYLPHHPVVKESSSTTKVRPVFDGSSKTKSSLSLNDCLEVGPCLLPDLVSVLLRFRRWPVAVVADISKAFLQVGVAEADRDALRFLREGLDGSMEHWRFRRVPFGLCCSPFLLNATIRVHLEKEGTDESFKILSDLYVDDLVSGCDTVEEACTFASESIRLLRKAGMSLEKWRSNAVGFAVEGQFPEANGSILSVLGISWNLETDVLGLALNRSTLVIPEYLTKRTLLKIIAGIYDPLGFISPFVLVAKLLFQRCWVLGFQWDERLSDDMFDQFREWLNEFNSVEFGLERSFFAINFSSLIGSDALQVHIFCDASEKAYGAVAYFRAVMPSGEVLVRFVYARVKSAPVKTVTLPRLELMAALLGARLNKFLRATFAELGSVPFFMWSDSTITLSWISTLPATLKTFVANRVVEIQSLTSASQWRHCSTDQNVADVLSRGCLLSSLLRSDWHNGPLWLRQPEDSWMSVRELPVVSRSKLPLVSRELRNVGSVVKILTVVDGCLSIWNYLEPRFSSLLRLKRVLVWFFKILLWLKSKKSHVPGQDCTVEELERAEYFCIQQAQMQSFSDEIHVLKGGDTLSQSSCLWRLNPFLDPSLGVLRARTRLDEADASYSFRFPIILPAKSRLTNLIIDDIHCRLGHVGVGVILSELRSRFWCIKGRRSVRAAIGKCIVCRRFLVKSSSEIPAPLPACRVRQNSPFSTTGIDYAGPLYDFKGAKVYIALFTCGVVRAIHLELVDSLDTSAFLMALQRFISRRGQPEIIYSDNGSHFRAADRILSKEFKLLNSGNVADFCSGRGIKWIFNPPSAPWWGGWWERLVGMVKHLLVRMLGNSVFNRVELSTMLCSCESVLNRRPLTYVSEDLESLSPLTPNHFLLPEGMIVEGLDFPLLVQTDRYMRKRLRLRSSVLASFFQRWRKEYLGELRCFHRDKGGSPPAVGQVVLIDTGNKRHNWPLAIVEEVISGADGLVRVVKVRSSSGTFLRPIQKVFPLECGVQELPPSAAELGKVDLVHDESDSFVEDANLVDFNVPDTTDANDIKVDNKTVTRSGRTVKIPSRLDL